MRRFSRRIRPHVDAELRLAGQAERIERAADAFLHLERAHVLGQASTVQHVRVHVRMLAWAWRQRDSRELAGQLLRIVGAATKTVFGLVPTGNTGGSNVSPFKRMAVPDELAAIIQSAKGNAD